MDNRGPLTSSVHTLISFSWITWFKRTQHFRRKSLLFLQLYPVLLFPDRNLPQTFCFLAAGDSSVSGSYTFSRLSQFRRASDKCQRIQKVVGIRARWVVFFLYRNGLYSFCDIKLGMHSTSQTENILSANITQNSRFHRKKSMSCQGI